MTINTVPYLQQEYANQKKLFENQPAIIQRFLEGQAQFIAEALVTKITHARFFLPDHVVTQFSQNGKSSTVTISEAERQIKVRSFISGDVREPLMHRLNELEKSADEGIAVSAGLLRYAASMYMIHNMLPAGRTVTYRAGDDEQIPTIPVEDNLPESAITQASDAIAEEGDMDDRGEVQTPFIPAARKFFLPQWVAFDDQGKLLVGSVKEAEAHVQSIQRYVMILHRALSLTPYVSANEEYQHKRYGILGQLINQGRALANFKTNEIISEIKGRVEKQSLNRGLSITLPYFDDQTLVMEKSNIEIIPAGRIMFVPAFVVRAMRQEEVKVSQDTRLNQSTRKHLLHLLDLLEQAFETQ
ncbi:MAG TPA: hypothetical protein VK206_11015 [Anaerolineales bacterium]|nr:hypothetical protein [Anaerolineales bacterium]